MCRGTQNKIKHREMHDNGIDGYEMGSTYPVRLLSILKSILPNCFYIKRFFKIRFTAMHKLNINASSILPNMFHVRAINFPTQIRQIVTLSMIPTISIYVPSVVRDHF